jgi:hypothetical protein
MLWRLIFTRSLPDSGLCSTSTGIKSVNFAKSKNSARFITWPLPGDTGSEMGLVWFWRHSFLRQYDSNSSNSSSSCSRTLNRWTSFAPVSAQFNLEQNSPALKAVELGAQISFKAASMSLEVRARARDFTIDRNSGNDTLQLPSMSKYLFSINTLGEENLYYSL